MEKKKKPKVSKYEIERQLSRQDYECALCYKPFKEGVKYYIDHCHEYGQFRGLLCFNCNIALGHLKDNRSVIERINIYLDMEMMSQMFI